MSQTVPTAVSSDFPTALASPELEARNPARAASELLPELYDELLRLARTRVRRACIAAILSPAELVHEAYLRLAQTGKCFDGRRHFFFAAARAMRDAVVEALRRRDCLKRGGGVTLLPLDELPVSSPAPAPHLIDLGRALGKLDEEFPEGARVVRLSYFAGLTQPQISEVMGLSRATVERRWAHARNWLRHQLGSGRASTTARFSTPDEPSPRQ
jgi:RNA polymerase sigma factor (TIGR02999 family)